MLRGRKRSIEAIDSGQRPDFCNEIWLRVDLQLMPATALWLVKWSWWSWWSWWGGDVYWDSVCVCVCVCVLEGRGGEVFRILTLWGGRVH